MKKKTNLKKLIDNKTKYQKKYNDFSKISWVRKIMLRSKLREIRKTIDLMTGSNIVTKSSSKFSRFILKILIKIFKIEISKNNSKNSNREKVRNGLYRITENILYNRYIREKKAEKDNKIKLINDLNSVITKHYGKSEIELTRMLLELEKENKYLNDKINSITKQKEYIGKQESTFSANAKLVASDDVIDVNGLIKRLGVNQIKPVDLFYKHPDDIIYMKHD
jgi:hypothetical protein